MLYGAGVYYCSAEGLALLYNSKKIQIGIVNRKQSGKCIFTKYIKQPVFNEVDGVPALHSLRQTHKTYIVPPQTVFNATCFIVIAG